MTLKISCFFLGKGRRFYAKLRKLVQQKRYNYFSLQCVKNVCFFLLCFQICFGVFGLVMFLALVGHRSIFTNKNKQKQFDGIILAMCFIYCGKRVFREKRHTGKQNWQPSTAQTSHVSNHHSITHSFIASMVKLPAFHSGIQSFGGG